MQESLFFKMLEPLTLIASKETFNEVQSVVSKENWIMCGKSRGIYYLENTKRMVWQVTGLYRVSTGYDLVTYNAMCSVLLG